MPRTTPLFLLTVTCMPGRTAPPPPDSTTAPAWSSVCQPVSQSEFLVVQANSIWQEGDPIATRLYSITESFGTAGGKIVAFHSGRAAGTAVLGKSSVLTVEPSPPLPPNGELWGLGGEYLTQRISDSSRLHVLTDAHFTICDPNLFLAEASLDTNGDDVIEFEFGWRICPEGSAFEIRERLGDPSNWRTVARWITPWPPTEGAPKCQR